MIARFAAGLLILASPVAAEEPVVAIFGGSVTRDRVEAERVVGGGGTVDIKSLKTDSAFFAGGSLNLADVTADELVVFGGNVGVKALSIGSLELAGGNVTLSGQFRDDISVAGGNVNIESETKIGGDLDVEAGNSVVHASVGGDTTIEGERTTISGQFGGDVRIRAKSVKIEPGTVIKADLMLPNVSNFVLPDGVTVGGKIAAKEGAAFARDGVKITVDLDDDKIEKEVNEKVQAAVERAERESSDDSDESGLIWPRPIGMGAWFTIIATLAACGALALAFAPRFVAGAAQRLSHQPLESLGIGLGSLVLVPLALFLVGVTFIGIPFAVLGFAAYAIGIGLGLITLCLWGGLYLRTFAQQPGDETRVPRLVGWTLMGFLTLALIGAIPFVGRWIQILAVMAGAGAVLGTAWAARKSRTPAIASAG